VCGWLDTRFSQTMRFALRPPFETHSTCFGDWLALKKQACRRFQEKRPFAAHDVRRAGAVPEPASRLFHALREKDATENCFWTPRGLHRTARRITSSSSAKAP
jgi:hypothetical protein